MKNKLKIAIYMRLSKEDDRIKTESNSISMQRILLKGYAAKHFDSYELLEFQDDGYSGTNFNRPGITGLLDMVKESAIDCIIVKDFSRFARDYIELGSYLEQIFPFMGVRFISVNDNYDSEKYKGKVADIDVSFKNLMYDLYSKDLSVKIKSAMDARKEKGKYISGVRPFGYRKVPDDRNSLVIHGEEAKTVKYIFELSASGLSYNKIALRLNQEGIKTPGRIKVENGEHVSLRKNCNFLWTISSVSGIIRNCMYTGDYYYNRSYSRTVGGRREGVPREEWKIYHDHHEPIVSRELFEKAQKNGKSKNNNQKKCRHILIGKVHCGSCGKSLEYKDRNDVNPGFKCRDRYTSGNPECIKKVNAMFLEQYVLFELYQALLQREDGIVTESEQKALLKEEWEKLNQEAARLRKRQADIEGHRMEEYEAYAMKKQDTFDATGKKETEEISSRLSILDQRMSELENKLTEKTAGSPERLEDVDFSVLTKDMVDQYVKNIIVYDEGNLEIQWNFAD